MPSAVTCGDCGAQFEVTQQLWDDQIDGKRVRARCKRCGAEMELDGRDPDAAPKHSKPPPPNAREKLTSIIDAETEPVREETPTVPLIKPGQLPAAGKLLAVEAAAAEEKQPRTAAHTQATQAAEPSDPWLVSYADDDDRELSTSAVKAAFEKGEIHTETLIWRDGMDEWLTITEVQVFAELFKQAPATDQTGGFLGTGLGLGVGPGGPTIDASSASTDDAWGDDDAPPISLVPDSLPPESIDPDSVEPKLVALSAGTMTDTKPKGPPPRREHATATTPKPGGVKLPTPKIAKDQTKAAAPTEAPRIKRLPKPPAAPLTKTGFMPSQPSNPRPEAAKGAEDEPSTGASAGAAKKPQGKSTPHPPANLKRPQTVAFEAEGPVLDSIPDVATLARKAGSVAKQDATAPDLADLPLTGSVDLGGVALGSADDAPLAPTIQVDDLQIDVDTGDGSDAHQDDAALAAAGAAADAGGADATSSAVSSEPGKQQKKKRSPQSGPPSSGKIRTETLSDAPVTRSRPPAAASSKLASAKAVASQPPADDVSGSKTPLYVALGLAAAFAVYWFGFRGGAPPEQPKPPAVATQAANTATNTPTADSPSTAEPAATAEPIAETDEPAQPAAGPTGTNPTDIAKPLGTAAAPDATAAPKPTATAEAPKPTADKPAADKPAEPTTPPTAKPPPDEPTAVATAPFDVAAARSALASAAAAASSCRKPGDPSGVAQVTITFAPSGRATSANIGGPPFAGTATGGCIAGKMRGARVPPFTGTHKTVSKTVVIN